MIVSRGDNDRQDYLGAFEEAGRDPVSGAPSERAQCIAEAIVDGVGLEELRDATTPREIAEAANCAGAPLAEPDTEQADAIFTGIQDCGDPADMFLDAIPGAPLPDAAASCFKDHVDDDLLREIIMTCLIEGDPALAEIPDLTTRLTEIGRACAMQGAQ